MSDVEIVRQSFGLPRLLSERLDAAAKGGPSKMAIVTEALTAWFERSGDDELELRFARRLDRLSSQHARTERNSKIHLESFAIFVEYMLTINAPIADDDEAARALGRDRFRAFIERVARQLASGRQTFGDEDSQ